MRRTCLGFAIFALAAIRPALADDIPGKLAPPQGAVLIGAYKATGVQVYVCTAQGSALQPVLKAPDAQLMENGKVVARHYAGPTWEASDGSKVVGKLLESVRPPRDSDISWLLLTAESTGQGLLAGTRFVQRIETSGGAAPATGCITAGTELRVPYSATYRFFR